MKEKNIKFIMELIFIFILPLLFILPNISINNNYVYDNDGNFETSSKEIVYDSIVYNQYYKNYLDFNQLVDIPLISSSRSGVSSIFDSSINGLTFTGSNISYLSMPIYNGIPFIEDNIYYIGFESNFTIPPLYLIKGIGGTLFYSCESFIYQSTYTGNINFSLETANTIDFTGYYFKNLMVINLTQMFGSGFEPSTIEELSNYIDLSIYYSYTDSKIIEFNGPNIISIDYNEVKSPFIYIKDLFGGFLNIDKNNITFNIVIDYTCIWFLMFVLWHLVYCLFDFIIHLIRIKRKE